MDLPSSRRPARVGSHLAGADAVPQPAGFAQRLAGWLLDVVGVWLTVIAGVASASSLSSAWGLSLWGSTHLMAAGAIGSVLLYASCEAWGRASPGKWAVGLRVTAADGWPAPAGARVVRAALRASPLLVPFAIILLPAPARGTGRASPPSQTIEAAVTFGLLLPPALYVIGCLRVFCRARQAAHDRLTGTAIYDRATLGRRGPDLPQAGGFEVGSVRPASLT